MRFDELSQPSALWSRMRFGRPLTGKIGQTLMYQQTLHSELPGHAAALMQLRLWYHRVLGCEARARLCWQDRTDQPQKWQKDSEDAKQSVALLEGDHTDCKDRDDVDYPKHRAEQPAKDFHCVPSQGPKV